MLHRHHSHREIINIEQEERSRAEYASDIRAIAEALLSAGKVEIEQNGETVILEPADRCRSVFRYEQVPQGEYKFKIELEWQPATPNLSSTGGPIRIGVPTADVDLDSSDAAVAEAEPSDAATEASAAVAEVEAIDVTAEAEAPAAAEVETPVVAAEAEIFAAAEAETPAAAAEAEVFAAAAEVETPAAAAEAEVFAAAAEVEAPGAATEADAAPETVAEADMPTKVDTTV